MYIILCGNCSAPFINFHSFTVRAWMEGEGRGQGLGKGGGREHVLGPTSCMSVPLSDRE